MRSSEIDGCNFARYIDIARTTSGASTPAPPLHFVVKNTPKKLNAKSGCFQQRWLSGAIFEAEHMLLNGSDIQ
jgi:hypothetical protein